MFLAFSCLKEEEIKIECASANVNPQEKIKGASILQTWKIAYESTQGSENIITQKTKTQSMIIAITGASGVGKTSILKALSKSLPTDTNVSVFHFDDIDFPNWDELEDHKKWQEDATIEWIDKIVKVARAENVHVLFEGSTEIKYFIQGFEKNNFSDYKILLFDCTEEVMKNRLIERGQPELYQADMIGWLNYLRRDAIERDIEIVRTDKSTIPETGQRILAELS